MRVFAAALAAMLLAATQPAQRLHVSDVRSITIDSGWSGLGKPSTYRTTITRKGDAFVRDDGSAVASNAIRALLRAAQETHLTGVSAANAGLTGAQLRWYLPAAEDALAAAKSDANVRAVFVRTFTDPSRAQRWMSDEARTMHTDDGPSIRILISSTRGTIALASRSYHLLMLPFEVDGGPASGAAYDARISYAIASLLPKGATNKQRLEERWLV
ncbi:MAG TPA: hypothetical protein VFN49_02835, partial [Candidatus Aquilonibacter sp.]|nr:hypothetical protein [Candidatus Aquilonibacter sp.]